VPVVESDSAAEPRPDRLLDQLGRICPGRRPPSCDVKTPRAPIQNAAHRPDSLRRALRPREREGGLGPGSSRATFAKKRL
jgi:hypothetical protein